ncbi:hypothetical protein BVRB_6g144040 [Beta vulgaris subsp. vulgaris]|uniref:Uncharacterized protein n=1 Tax=Beta vulgaris subsp. vulgaris TaxID=3555 RepID=A0A0J8C7T0_BETVV|nr:hypothetical protein BVRB_6g144040 [Beta vulgaris subsp. vulgaris]
MMSKSPRLGVTMLWMSCDDIDGFFGARTLFHIILILLLLLYQKPNYLLIE